ncbi:MAG: hypothetical protein ACHQ49_04415 [Elusimicrobiota bacterium]
MNAGLMTVQVASSALFFYLWIVMGWADFHRQKIRNQYLRYAAWGVSSGYAFLLAMTVLGCFNRIGVFPYWGYYQEALANAFLCGAAALALWWFGVWPAGDAKLFILLAVLYPLTNFIAASDYRRLFLVALINTFIPASVAVFLRAARYVFETRLIHRRHFLVQLGWRKELDFLLDSVRERASGLGAVRSSAAEFARAAAASPGPFLARTGLWVANMMVLSFFSYYLKDFFRSPILFTLFWGAMFLFWSRLATVIGASYTRAAVAALGAALLFFRPPAHWPDIGRIFLNLSLFNFFFRMGIRWTMTVLSGSAGAAYVVTLLLPLAGAGAAAAAARLGGAAPVYVHTFLVLAGMGVFFGLSLVLVRLWDQEVLPSAIGEVSSYAVLAPGFIERLRLDSEFFEEHFSRLYADGLTGPQAQALQEWCAREGVDMIPLTPTISFAAWIFLGFFLARIMKGAHVMGLLF